MCQDYGIEEMTMLFISAKSDIGSVRDHNEDNFGFLAEQGLVVLSDGMGGYQAGEVASAIAVTTIFQTIEQLRDAHGSSSSSPYTHAEMLYQAVRHANRLIFQAAIDDRDCQGMGTTLTAGWFDNDRMCLAHVGDSRLYRYRGYQLELLSTDHTVVQELLDNGFYSREEAKNSAQRNIVTRALGVGSSIEIDIREVDTMSGDIYLFCSDGLNDMLDDREISNILRRSSTDLDYGVSELIDKAIANGGNDNVTVVLVRVGEARIQEASWLKRLFRS
ncbi:MAG TPA: Stp1/IreP family PP2C-type Ser/Thr phosphatase [Gammaproteobacteria bacterium]|nr:Stp1/IreP family PP2C-type Ser/Thr phosphatase [Gammaproteobacteria bacterium]